VRVTCDKLNVNAELFGDESADIVDWKTFRQGVRR
jgi:hypothetical protein